MPQGSKRVNYVIATWGGPRRLGGAYGNYTYKHLKFLEKIKHNLDQITVVWPDNQQELYSYRKYMESIDGTEINGTPVKVLKTKNRFQSYGQYISAFKKFGNDFDYFIFTEDDYVAVANDFDKDLIDSFEKNHKEKRCGYLCGYSFPCEYVAVIWAGVSWGISRSDILKEVGFDFDKMRENVNGVGEYPKYQFLFSAIFLNARYTICDLSENHNIGFLFDTNYIKYWGDGPEIIAPIQYLEPDYYLYPKSFLETHYKGLRLFK